MPFTSDEREQLHTIPPDGKLAVLLTFFKLHTPTFRSITKAYMEKNLYVEYHKDDPAFMRELLTRLSFLVGGSAITLASIADTALSIPALTAALITFGNYEKVNSYAVTSFGNALLPPFYLVETVRRVVHPSWEESLYFF